MIRKIKFFHFMLIVATIMPIVLLSSGIAVSADNTQIVINENLKPGMTLKDAIELLGPPDTMRASDTGTIIMPYDSLGLSIETMSDGTVIERINIKSAFKGKFSSGFGIGADFQEILSAYNQPDKMTKEIIEYSDRATIFQISQGKLVGADLYSDESALFPQVSGKEAGAYVAEKYEKNEDEVTETYEDGEAEKSEDDEIRNNDEYDVFDLYGFSVKTDKDKIIITEIRPGSVAESGGLKVGERIRKAFYKGLSVRNIYTVGGLKAVLERAVDKRKKEVNILQDENYYYKVEVPKRN